MMETTARQTHTSRAQEARAANPIREDNPLFLEDVGPLPNIPPRPGYNQRWILTQTSSGMTGRNISRAMQRGWAPRPADTVPKAFQSMTVLREGMGGVIGTHDMILMERPVEITEKVAAINRGRVRDLEQAVSQIMFREHERLREQGGGIYPNRMESQSEVIRGRMPVAQDED